MHEPFRRVVLRPRFLVQGPIVDAIRVGGRAWHRPADAAFHFPFRRRRRRLQRRRGVGAGGASSISSGGSGARAAAAFRASARSGRGGSVRGRRPRRGGVLRAGSVTSGTGGGGSLSAAFDFPRRRRRHFQRLIRRHFRLRAADAADAGKAGKQDGGKAEIQRREAASQGRPRWPFTLAVPQPFYLPALHSCLPALLPSCLVAADAKLAVTGW